VLSAEVNYDDFSVWVGIRDGGALGPTGGEVLDRWQKCCMVSSRLHRDGMQSQKVSEKCESLDCCLIRVCTPLHLVTSRCTI
jgi:hypothetical protein